MADPLKLTVTGMPASGTLDNDGRVEMRFTTEEGTDLWLKFSAEHIDRFAVRAHQGSILARIQKAATAGHLAVHGEAVAALEAEPSVGGSTVLLIVRTPKREVIPYSLTLKQAGELHAALAEAIAQARDDAGQTRQ